MSANRTLQIIGVIIIFASITAVAIFTQAAITSAVDINQPARTDVETDIAAISQTGGHIVEIPFSAGRQGTLFEYFTPSSVSIQTGDTVTWVNRDTVGHTVTSVAFNSDQIWPQTEESKGNSTFSHTFDRNGVYSYFCQIHPYMSGTVYVDAEETQRQLLSTVDTDVQNIIVEMPYDTAYHYNFDQGFFIPANTIVPAGARVTWINNDYVAHTATATDGSFDTTVLDPRESKSLVIDKEGRIAYYCRIHPWMQASLTVTSTGQ